MIQEQPVPAQTRARLQPVLVGVLAAAIFYVDTFFDLPDAVAVLYVVVVLLSVNFLERRGTLLLSAGCCVAAVATYFVDYGASVVDAAFVRLLVSIVAIGITGLLAARNATAVASLRRQASLLDLTHDAILVRSLDDVITYWSRGAEMHYGWPSDYALDKFAPQLLRTAFPIPLEDIKAEVLRTGRWEGETTQTRRDGRQQVVASRWSLQRDNRGRPVAIMETDTDITDRRQAEDSLSRMQAQLAHAARVATLGELTASIAHEVNQPLAAVVTNGQVCIRLLDQKVPDLTEVRAAIVDMVAAGQRASEIIQRLRALFKKAETRKVLLDVNDLVREVVPLVERELRSKGVSLRLELAPGLPAVWGDHIQLQQVIINLILNGSDAMADVTDRQRELVICTQLAAGRVSVAIRNSGVGLGQEAAKQLFDPFFTTKPEGLGMGLTISRSIIETPRRNLARLQQRRARRHVSVSAAPRPGGGRMMVDQSRTATPAGGDQPIVFIVEDDAPLREALIRLFRTIGLRTVVFGSAAELLSNTLPDVPACLLLDVRLPGFSGLDIQARLAETGNHIPIVFMTGHGDIPMSVEAMKAGAVDFLTKPFRDQDMLDAVVAAIERDRGRREHERATSDLKLKIQVVEPTRTRGHGAGHYRADEQAGGRRIGAQRDHSQNPSRERHEENGRQDPR